MIPELLPVIAQEDDKRVARQIELLQCIEKTGDLPVDVRDLAVVHGRELALPVGRQEDKPFKGG